MSEEQVLVFPVAAFPSLAANGFTRYERWTRINAVLKTSFFMPKSAAEKNERYKQIIPYSLFRYGEQQVFSYTRSADYGEPRLAGKHSIGIGGHLNTDDFPYSAAPDSSGVLRGALREAREEFSFGPVADIVLRGVMNENLTPVSRVHFGVIIDIYLHDKRVVSSEENHAVRSWVTISELVATAHLYEGWSQYLIEQYLAN